MKNNNGIEQLLGKTLTEEICKLAVQENWLTLKLIEVQTEDICKLTVQEWLCKSLIYN